MWSNIGAKSSGGVSGTPSVSSLGSSRTASANPDASAFRRACDHRGECISTSPVNSKVIGRSGSVVVVVEVVLVVDVDDVVVLTLGDVVSDGAKLVVAATASSSPVAPRLHPDTATRADEAMAAAAAAQERRVTIRIR